MGFTKKKHKVKKVKKIKRAPKVAKKALKKKKRVVKMLRTNVFSSEVVDTHIHKHNPSPVDEFLGDIGVGPKVKKQAAPVPIRRRNTTASPTCPDLWWEACMSANLHPL